MSGGSRGRTPLPQSALSAAASASAAWNNSSSQLVAPKRRSSSVSWASTGPWKNPPKPEDLANVLFLGDGRLNLVVDVEVEATKESPVTSSGSITVCPELTLGPSASRSEEVFAFDVSAKLACRWQPQDERKDASMRGARLQSALPLFLETEAQMPHPHKTGFERMQGLTRSSLGLRVGW
eukprot:CAMPEP_0181452330 /NCGR_PEP_ID=MMETSP1110-20121109/29151_1 /TAXON_ID=174948 /ORGANISM="Symbiodinium sp., Strain CCMP421" /LENGTH=179 /DNA_ID=CAMNT_0023576609 /DNA_START=430 /DNA_END=970 /DNA_ORIENTATION=+